MLLSLATEQSRFKLIKFINSAVIILSEPLHFAQLPIPISIQLSLKV